MRMAKSLSALAMTCAATLGVAVMSAQPASADSYTCDSGEYCVWNDLNYYLQNGIFTTAGGLSDYVGWNFYYGGSARLENRVSSWKNNGVNSGPTVIYSYRDKNGGGGELWRGGLGAKQGYVGDSKNDAASSHYWFYS